MVDAYQINNYEYGKTVENKIKGSTIRVAKLAIPKFMTSMEMGLYDTKVAVNGNVFVNAPECAVSTPVLINCRGYCTIEKYSTEVINLSNKAKKDKSGGTYIPKGTKIMVEILYEDVLNMHIIGKD